MHRSAGVLLAMLFLPERAIGQAAWLGSEELHRAVGGALESALKGILPLLLLVVVLITCGFLYGATRLIELQFTSPRPAASTGIALVLFSVSFWAFMAALGAHGAAWLLVGGAVGLLPALLVLAIELARIRRSEERPVASAREVETAEQD